MPASSSRTLSVLVATGLLTLSFASSIDALPNTSGVDLGVGSEIYQTTSIDRTASMYQNDFISQSPRDEALALFGAQESYTDAERETYWSVINAKSIDTAVNIFDLL